MILVGGLGTRLGERDQDDAQALAGRRWDALLETLIGEARRRGFDDFLLPTGHRSEAVAAFLADRDIEKRFTCRVELSIEPAPLGTGGALIHALPRLSDDFLLLNGDTWFDFNWLDLMANARRDRRAPPWRCARSTRPTARHGRVDGSLVRAIRPRGQNLASALINGGVYFFTRRAVEGPAAPSSLQSDILREARRTRRFAWLPLLRLLHRHRRPGNPRRRGQTRAGAARRPAVFSIATAFSTSTTAMSTRLIKSSGFRERRRR